MVKVELINEFIINTERVMVNSKLGIGLSGLKPEEWKSLFKFVLMDHNETSDHFLLLKRMKKSLWSNTYVEDSKTFKAKFFSHMSMKSFLNLSSRVFMSFEDWLVWYECKKNKISKDVLLVKIYNRRGLFPLADKKYFKVEKALTAKGELTLDTARNLTDLNYYHHFSENEVKFSQGGKVLQNAVRAALSSLHEIGNIYLLEMRSYGEMVDFDYSEEIKLLEEVLVMLPTSKTSELTAKLQDAYVMRDSLKLQEIYQTLHRGEVEPDSDLEVLISLYGSLFSSQLFNEGVLDEPKLVFNFYDYSLKSGILNKLGKITCIKFLNMTAVIIHTQSVADSELFVRRWIHLIEDEIVESALNICLAYVRMKEEKYDAIIYLLRAQNYKSQNTQFIALGMELTAFYKLNDWEVLDYKLKNFKRRLRNSKSKVTQLTYMRFLNYVNIINQLSKHNFNTKVQIDLSYFDNVFNKAWLMKELKSKGL